MAHHYINPAEEFRSDGVTEFLRSVCSTTGISAAESCACGTLCGGVRSREAELCVLVRRDLPAHAQSAPVLFGFFCEPLYRVSRLR